MKTILITGANRGIGLELTRRYLDNGDSVIACCRAPKKASDLQELKQAGATIEVHALEVTDSGTIAALKDAIGTRPIDILINNAGVIGPNRQSVMDMDFDGFLEALNINTLAPLRMLQAFLPNLKAATQPKAITISSRMGSFTSIGTDRVAYRTSKSAVNRLMFAAAGDLKPDGIVVAVMHPGWVRTDMGGPSATLSPTESAAGLARVIEKLNLSDSGGYFDCDGSKIGW